MTVIQELAFLSSNNNMLFFLNTNRYMHHSNITYYLPQSSDSSNLPLVIVVDKIWNDASADGPGSLGPIYLIAVLSLSTHLRCNGM